MAERYRLGGCTCAVGELGPAGWDPYCPVHNPAPRQARIPLVNGSVVQGAKPPPVAGEHTAKVGWKLMWGEVIGDPACPLMQRWGINTPWGSLRLHHFIRGDSERHLHDHPWWFVTLVLRGGYMDMTRCQCRAHLGWVASGHRMDDNGECAELVGERLRPGAVRYRPATHAHAVRTDDAWTVVLTGPPVRNWGFVLGATNWLKEHDYFARYGHAACEDLEEGRRG